MSILSWQHFFSSVLVLPPSCQYCSKSESVALRNKTYGEPSGLVQCKGEDKQGPDSSELYSWAFTFLSQISGIQMYPLFSDVSHNEEQQRSCLFAWNSSSPLYNNAKLVIGCCPAWCPHWKERGIHTFGKIYGNEEILYRIYALNPIYSFLFFFFY